MPVLTAKWSRLATSARLQRSSHTLAVIGGKAWVFGGELKPREPVDNQFDMVNLAPGPVADVSTVPAPCPAPSPRVGTASAALGGNIYLFSGRGGVAMAPIEENGAVWSYSPAASKWTLVSPADSSAPYPAARSYHTATSDGKGTFYIHAGCPEKGRLSDLWAFSTTARAWEELAPAPEPPRGGSSITFHDGKLYRMNGFDGQTEQGGSVDVFDVAANSWSSITYPADGVSGPAPRSVCTLVPLRVGGETFLLTMFGEHDPSALGHAGAGKMLGDVWAFDLGAKEWSKLVQANGETPAPRGWFDADITKEGESEAVVVHGGLAEDNSRLGDVWKLEVV